MASECEVCYAAKSHCKLVCGHSFCFECVKKWYNKGSAQNCPMCRAPIYFKGMYKKRQEWVEEAYQTKVNEVFSEHFDATLEEGLGEAETISNSFPTKYKDGIRKEILEDVISDLANLEKTHGYLKNEQVHEDDIDEVHYYGDYYSNRKIGAKNQFRERPRDLPPPRKERRAVSRGAAPRYSKR